MMSPVRRLSTSTLLAILTVCASHTALAQGLTEKLSERDIRDIEPNVRMPRGAESLGKYVRYYYVQANSPGWIFGMYVAKHYFNTSDNRLEEIVVVNSSADIPAPYDAGCDVVLVSYDIENSKIGAVYCAPELSL